MSVQIRNGKIDKSIAENGEPAVGIPETFSVRNYPNPFNPEMYVKVALPEENNLTITVFNSLGQKIRLLVNGNYSPGYYNFKWDGKDDAERSVNSGMYFFRIQTDNKNYFLKALMVK